MTETMHQEQVVMTPKGKTSNSTTLIIERRAIKPSTDTDKMHVAGGEHTGIVINKEAIGDNINEAPAELSLEFRVFLVSGQTGKHSQECRTLRFWFRPEFTNGHGHGHINGGTTTTNTNTNGYTIDSSTTTVAQDFFRELVTPQDFPRDYVGFIKKIMKLMQHNYQTIRKMEVELKQLEEAEVTRPLSGDENSIGNVVLLSVEKVLELIESAYPNPIVLQELARDNNWDEEEVAHHLAELQSRGLVKAMDHGAFTRQQSLDTQVTVVKQMPTIASSKQPTIAIITAQYCEKLAVDAMIENKETFVRYTTVGATSPTTDGPRTRFGESNVYTMGNIGAHRIVCTKLPSVGHTREAMTAAGNTTTRLLGTFQKVDYVFLVGVAGGVPHYTDYNKHVRLGDVVVSYPHNKKHVYVYCDNVNKTEKGYEFEVKNYGPSNLNLQEIAYKLRDEAESHGRAAWIDYLQEGLNNLSNSEQDFKAPPPETDKLYMSIGEGDLIEVAHPQPTQKSQVQRQDGCPRVHLATIGSGRQIVRTDDVRQHFAAQFGALAFDCEFDAVIESVLGNCKESFVCIRGISDYKDGTRRKEWQPYASAAAASVMKAIICGMEPPANV